MNKASWFARERLNLDLSRFVPAVQASVTNAVVRRPLKSLRKVQASGMPLLPLSR